MALSLATGSAQLTAGATLTPLYVPTAYVVQNDMPGETRYANTSAPLDQPNGFRLAITNIADVFKGVPNLSPVAGQNRGGLSMLAQLTETWKVDDAADSLAPYYLPFSAHLVIKAPADALVTSAVVFDGVRRLLGTLIRNSTDALSVGINNQLHSITKW